MLFVPRELSCVLDVPTSSLSHRHSPHLNLLSHNIFLARGISGGKDFAVVLARHLSREGKLGTANTREISGEGILTQGIHN